MRDDEQYYRPLYNIEQVEILRGSDALTQGLALTEWLTRYQKRRYWRIIQCCKRKRRYLRNSFSLDNNYELGEEKALRVNMFGDNLENHRDYYYGNSFGVNPTMRMNLGDGSA